jgi:hypothetical protein
MNSFPMNPRIGTNVLSDGSETYDLLIDVTDDLFKLMTVSIPCYTLGMAEDLIEHLQSSTTGYADVRWRYQLVPTRLDYLLPETD